MAYFLSNIGNSVIFKDYDGKEYFLFEGKDGFRIENYRKGRDEEERVKEQLERLLKEKEGWKLDSICDDIIGKGADYYLYRLRNRNRSKRIAIEVKKWDFDEMYLTHFLEEILTRFEGLRDGWRIVLIKGKVKIRPEILYLARKLGIIIVRSDYELKKVVDGIIKRIEKLEAGKNREVEVKKYVYEGILWVLAVYMKELMIKIIRIIGVLGNCVYEGIKGIWKGVILKRIFLGKTPRGIDLKSMRKEDFIEAGKTIIRIKGKG